MVSATKVYKTAGEEKAPSVSDDTVSLFYCLSSLYKICWG